LLRLSSGLEPSRFSLISAELIDKFDDTCIAFQSSEPSKSFQVATFQDVVSYLPLPVRLYNHEQGGDDAAVKCLSVYSVSHFSPRFPERRFHATLCSLRSKRSIWNFAKASGIEFISFGQALVDEDILVLWVCPKVVLGILGDYQ
jgi:hypothetical protein